MNLPLVAVVGRPNVGKSTFINRVAVKSETIVDEMPGVTRDRKYVEADWAGKNFTLIDTGGLDFSGEQPIVHAVTQQALLAVEQADFIIFMVDAKTGLLPDDEDIAKVKLGLGEPFVISSLHGLGVGDLLDKVLEKLPAISEETEKEALSIAIVGRPNVGKSSILNKLLGQERVIVSELPGTTRDSIDTVISINDQRFKFIDTAGLRKRGKVTENVEYYGLVRALRTLDRADIALIIVDASEGATEQDQRVAEMAESRSCGIIVLLNKWDLVKGPTTQKKLLSNLAYKMRFISYAPLLKVSAQTGKGMSRVFELINVVDEEYRKKISTPVLNNLITELKEEGFAPVKRNKKLRLSYATQVQVAPPTFVFFVNHPELANTNYQRYIKRRLRKQFGFIGCPVLLRFRKKSKSSSKASS